MPPRPLLTITTVSELTGIPADVIISKSRRPHVVQARHITMYVMRFRYNMTCRQVAEIFGSEKHGVVLHACMKVNRYMTDPVVKERVEWLMRVVVY
jgi:chromosomal replication initiator protein